MLDILEAIEDEGSDRAIFVISADKSAWLGFEGTKDFWETVAARFEEATDDIANAMLCFGYEQNTACVFHLMRVLEYGLAAMAKEVGRTFDRQQWQNIIEEIESAIRDLRKSPQTPEKAARLQFLSEAAKVFFYFKDGWRNYVSHNHAAYDENQARSIIEHVKTFMTVLAKKLPKASETSEASPGATS